MKGFVPTQCDPEDSAWLSEEDLAAVGQAKQRLQSCLRRYLGHPDAPAPVYQKVYRIATARFLQAVDHALKVVSGHGLERWATEGTSLEAARPGSQREALASWRAQPLRTLTVAADQQSCGPSGVTFLQAHPRQLAVDLVFDPPHRFWNSEKLGLVMSGGWEAVLLTTVLYSISDGPWHTGGWFSQLNGARQDYLALTDRATCPLFSKMLPHVARDKGRESEMGTEAFSKEMWAELSTDNKLLFKGPRPALCRWYSWFDCHRFWKPAHHLRLLTFIVWGLGAELLTRTARGDSLVLGGAPPVEPVSESKVTMREVQASTSRLRSKGKNLLHVALKIMQNPNIKRKADLVSEALLGMRNFHTDQIAACRTPEGNVAWSMKMASGSFLRPLGDSWALLADARKLHECGFLTTATACTAGGYLADTDMEDVEGSWAAWTVSLLCHLTLQRYRHLLFYTRGPGMLAALLSDSPDEQWMCLKTLGVIWRGWKACEAKPQAAEREARARSWLARPVVSILLQRLESLGWKEVPADVRETLHLSFSVISIFVSATSLS